MLAHEYVVGKTQKIIVILDQTEDGLLKSFQYYGGIKLLMPGGVDVPWLNVVGVPKIIQCKNKREVTLNDERKVLPLCKIIYYVIG
jgi:hypothetical protein